MRMVASKSERGKDEIERERERNEWKRSRFVRRAKSQGNRKLCVLTMVKFD